MMFPSVGLLFSSLASLPPIVPLHVAYRPHCPLLQVTAVASGLLLPKVVPVDPSRRLPTLSSTLRSRTIVLRLPDKAATMGSSSRTRRVHPRIGPTAAALPPNRTVPTAQCLPRPATVDQSFPALLEEEEATTVVGHPEATTALRTADVTMRGSATERKIIANLPPKRIQVRTCLPLFIILLP